MEHLLRHDTPSRHSSVQALARSALQRSVATRVRPTRCNFHSNMALVGKFTMCHLCREYIVNMAWTEDEDVVWDVHPQQEVVCRNKATKKWKGGWHYIDVHPFSDLDDLAIRVLCFRKLSEYFGTIGWPAAWVLSACEYGFSSPFLHIKSASRFKKYHEAVFNL